MKAKRILLYSHELSFTGAPFSLLRIANVLVRAGFYVEMWAPEEGPFSAEVAKSGVTLRIVPYSDLAGARAQEKIASFDMAIANTVVAASFYAAASRLIPTVWFIREAQNIPSFVAASPLAQALLRSSKDLYCVSEYAQEFIERTYGQRAKILRNAVEDRFNAAYSVEGGGQQSTVNTCPMTARCAFLRWG